MSDACCPPAPTSADPRYRRILWIALAANAAMFLVEVAASMLSGSSALAADAADFLGDSVNYGASLGALALGGLWISRVALAKGIAMSLFGVGVLAYAGWRAWLGVPPESYTMGGVALLAFAVNFGVAALLYRYREGDANMRSVWLCTRNDVFANIAVFVAALGVLGTGTVWPDVAVAAVLAGLALTSGPSVIAQARRELGVKLESTVTCPACGAARTETMPTDACVFFYDCPACGARAKPRSGDCCVYCSYGSLACPPKQLEAAQA